MSWNYRVIRKSTLGEYEFGIHEVYYNDDGSISSWTVDPVAPYGSNIDELDTCLEWMEKALMKPTLQEVDEGLIEVEDEG